MATESFLQRKRANTAKWVRRNPEKNRANIRRWQLARLGWTLESYNAVFAEQEGCCAICGAHNSGLKKGLAGDHDHETNKPRGLLCGNCNRGIGFFKDNISHLEKAIAYLRKHGGTA